MEPVFKKKVRTGEDKTVLYTYLLQVTTERTGPGILCGYLVALCSILFKIFKMRFFLNHMAFLITSVKGLSGAFLLGDRSLLTSVVFLLQVLEILWLS